MKLIVIGGDAAGMSCASQVKRQDPSAEVIVFERGDYVSYAACGMPYYIEGVVQELHKLLAVTPEEFIEKRQIDLRMHHEVLHVDPANRTVTVKKKDGPEFIEPYDTLLLATGARPIVPPFPGIELPGVYTLRSLNESQRIKEFIETHDPRTVAVIGGGYIGLELTEAFTERGLEVHVFEMLPRVLANYEEDISKMIEEQLRARGVHLHLNSPVRGFKGEQRVDRVLTDAGEFVCDFVVLGLGVRPNSELAKEAGIDLGAANAIHVNEYLETSAPGIYAAGDCADCNHLVSRQPVFIPLALNANKMGTFAGLNIIGEKHPFTGTLGSAVLKVFDLEVARTGLSLHEATEAGFECFKSVINASSKPHYYPGGKQLTVVYIVEKRTGRLLGAQIIGEDGAALRINIAATAIHNNMTMDGMMDLDLAYAPPFSTVWDPLLTAARVAAKKV